MRLVPSLLLILCLAACQRGGNKDTDAVRQGVLDRFTKTGVNVSAMDVKITDVKFNGEQADAVVAVGIKGQSSGVPMSFKYHLEHQNNKWVVISAASESHGGEADPNAAGTNPHGGAMPPAAGGGDPHGGGGDKMPSPHDLPPATKK